MFAGYYVIESGLAISKRIAHIQPEPHGELWNCTHSLTHNVSNSIAARLKCRWLHNVECSSIKMYLSFNRHDYDFIWFQIERCNWCFHSMPFTSDDQTRGQTAVQQKWIERLIVFYRSIVAACPMTILTPYGSCVPPWSHNHSHFIEFTIPSKYLWLFPSSSVSVAVFYLWINLRTDEMRTRA